MLGRVTSNIHFCKYLLFTILAIFIMSSGLEAQQQQTQESTVVILLGPPGAGKGTQASWLCSFLRLPHISTGDLLRSSIEEDSPLGRNAQEYMNQGKLVPDNLILELLLNRVAEEDCQKGYILDGFPRTVDQAKAYHERCATPSHLYVLNMNLSDQKIVDRLLKRRVCSKCNALFHLEYVPPKVENCCDYCSSGLVQRSDDQEGVIRDRLLVYHKQTTPLIDYYSKASNFHNISCAQSKEDMKRQIAQWLDKEAAQP